MERMNRAFEKILEFIDEQIKIEESIAKSENEGHPITHQYGANCMNVIKKFVQEVAEEFATDTNVGTNGWIPCSERLPEELKRIRAKKTCNKEKCDTKEICRICVVDDAIEIVKQGGLSNRKDCEYRHENGNCLKVGGFCTSVDDKHCEKIKQSTFGLLDIKEWGKTVFLTKSEAEAKLKELREKNETLKALYEDARKEGNNLLKRERNKAIDDFVKFANTMPTVETEDGEIRPMRLEEMAEQLKEGEIYD